MLCFCVWLRWSEPDVPASSESGVLVSQTSADLGSVSGGL